MPIFEDLEDRQERFPLSLRLLSVTCLFPKVGLSVDAIRFTRQKHHYIIWVHMLILVRVVEQGRELAVTV
jgi:hypothetical protein